MPGIAHGHRALAASGSGPAQVALTSGTISTMRVAAHGQLSLVDPSGISASGGSGSTTLDSSVTADGRYLSVLVFNTKPGLNSIVTFRIGSGGTLTWLNAAGSVPGSTTRLVNRLIASPVRGRATAALAPGKRPYEKLNSCWRLRKPLVPWR